MGEHKEELLSQNLLDNDEEIEETKKEGEWPGHAAIVALSNLLKVNIAVVQGGYRSREWVHRVNGGTRVTDRVAGS